MSKSKWSFSGWESFWESDGQPPEKVLLTTFTLDTNFLAFSLLPRLFGMSENEGTIEWYAAFKQHLRRTPVAVFVDAGHWQDARNRSVFFEAAGGHVYPVRVPDGIQRGIQHSKLWLLQFRDHIRIVIGSCNLTEEGFSGQIQCLWTADLERSKHDVEDKQTTKLKTFLDRLAKATTIDGKKAITYVEQWKKSLSNCTWPPDVSLVPVIPTKKTDALAGVKLALAEMNLVRTKRFSYDLQVQVFECGQLDKEWLAHLIENFYANSLRLHWPRAEGSPPVWKGMVLPETTAKTLLEHDSHCSIAALSFSKCVEKANERLPHGKVIAGREPHPKSRAYAFVVLGSSNLSKAAWSRNFELNVLLKYPGGVYFNDDTKDLTAKDVYVSEPPKYETNSKLDLYARWDKSDVVIEFSAPRDWQQIVLKLLDAKKNVMTEITQRIDKTNNSSTHRFDGPPATSHWLSASGTGPNSECTVPIIGSLADLVSNLLPHDADLERARHSWTLRQYGWNPEFKRAGDYRVPWVERAMGVIGTIDCWKEPALARRDAAGIELLESLKWFQDHSIGEERLGFELASNELLARLDGGRM